MDDYGKPTFVFQLATIRPPYGRWPSGPKMTYVPNWRVLTQDKCSVSLRKDPLKFDRFDHSRECSSLAPRLDRESKMNTNTRQMDIPSLYSRTLHCCQATLRIARMKTERSSLHFLYLCATLLSLPSRLSQMSGWANHPMVKA